MNVPHGQPNNMYAYPELHAAQDYLAPVSEQDLQLCRDACVFRTLEPCDNDMFQLCCLLLLEQNLILTNDPYELIDTYVVLRNEIRQTLV